MLAFGSKKHKPPWACVQKSLTDEQGDGDDIRVLRFKCERTENYRGTRLPSHCTMASDIFVTSERVAMESWVVLDVNDCLDHG